MINRREFPGIAAGAGATLALTPELLLVWPGSTIEFKVDPQGKVTGAAIDLAGAQLFPLERK